MATLETRIERLETRREGQGGIHAFKIRFIRPGDMAVVSELCMEPGKEPVWVHHAEHCVTAEARTASGKNLAMATVG